jgi:hypothetical protein
MWKHETYDILRLRLRHGYHSDIYVLLITYVFIDSIVSVLLTFQTDFKLVSLRFRLTTFTIQLLLCSFLAHNKSTTKPYNVLRARLVDFERLQHPP